MLHVTCSAPPGLHRLNLRDFHYLDYTIPGITEKLDRGQMVVKSPSTFGGGGGGESSGGRSARRRRWRRVGRRAACECRATTPASRPVHPRDGRAHRDRQRHPELQISISACVFCTSWCEKLFWGCAGRSVSCKPGRRWRRFCTSRKISSGWSQRTNAHENGICIIISSPLWRSSPSARPAASVLDPPSGQLFIYIA